jgi:lactate permease
MVTWTQTYAPVVGSLHLSALVAASPAVVLLALLALTRVRAHWAALAGLATSLTVAIFVFGMPWRLASLAALDGAAYGLFPIGWIVLSAIFVYDVTVKSGDFEVIKHSIASIASDRRLQALLIAFCFGAFMEGAAGFGTPVAISAAMLIGLGFRPLEAAGLALIGNTAPVAYGALGTPLIALAGVTGLPLETLSAMVGRILPFFSLLVPFWLIWVMCGFRPMREVWPACLTAGAAFGLAQALISNLHGPWLAGIGSSLASMAAMVVLLKFWQPGSIWSFEHETASERAEEAAARPALGASRTFKAWMPWILLSVLLFLWGTPQIKEFLNGGARGRTNFLNGVSLLNYTVPLLNKAVIRAVPAVPRPTAEAAVFAFNWLSATGTSLLIAGALSGLLLGFSPVELARVFLGTLRRVRLSLLTIAAMMSIGFMTRYSGLDATMGLAFARTGMLYPFFGTLLGWMGVALTGSDTASNVLFGSLQKISAAQVGVSPTLMCAANSCGGVMGKMIDAQSIVVASTATEWYGHEGDILRYVFFHSIALASLVGVVVFLEAYVFPWIIPNVSR